MTYSPFLNTFVNHLCYNIPLLIKAVYRIKCNIQLKILCSDADQQISSLKSLDENFLYPPLLDYLHIMGIKMFTYIFLYFNAFSMCNYYTCIYVFWNVSNHIILLLLLLQIDYLFNVILLKYLSPF